METATGKLVVRGLIAHPITALRLTTSLSLES